MTFHPYDSDAYTDGHQELSPDERFDAELAAEDRMAEKAPATAYLLAVSSDFARLRKAAVLIAAEADDPEGLADRIYDELVDGLRRVEALGEGEWMWGAAA